MKKIAIAVMLCVVAVPAVASDMYVGFRVGQANTSLDNITLDSSRPTGWGAFIGHDFNSNFAVEAEYLNLGEIKSGSNTVKSTGFSVSGIGSIPFNEQFSLFGKLGYAVITGTPGGGFTGSDANNRAVTYGFGGQFNITPAVGVRLGWDKYKFNDNTNPGFNGYGTNGNATLISIGGLIKF
jgi:OOP family OmpA-OmpF porin